MTVERAAIEEHLRSGDLDVTELIAAPERFGELGETVQSLTLGGVVALEREVAEGDVDEQAWSRVGLDPGTTLADLDAGDREWFADVLRFWRVRPRNVDETIAPD